VSGISKAQFLADEATRMLWDHWKLYKHGWDEPGPAPSGVVTLFEVALAALPATDGKPGADWPEAEES